MRFIPTKVHGYLDYVVGVLLMAAPWLLGFAQGDAETWVTVAMGIIAALYSLLTRYELGIVPLISMRLHLTIDFVFGVLLALSPWLFGFAGRVYVPHVVVGLFAIAASLLTQKIPSTRTNRHTGPAITLR